MQINKGMKYLKSYTTFGSISESLDTGVERIGQLCLHKTDSGNLASYVNDGILKSKYSNWQRGAGQPGIFFLTGTDESALFSGMETLGRGDNGLIIGKYLDLADTAQWNIDYEFEAGAVSHFLVKNLMANMPAELNLYYRADKTLYQKFSETDWQDLVQYVAIDAADGAYDNDDVDGHLYLIRSSQDQVQAADIPEHETHGPTLFRFWVVPFGRAGNAATGDHYNDLFWAKSTELRTLRDKIDRDVLEYMTGTGEPFAIKYMAELSQADRFPDRVWLKESGAWKEYSYTEAKSLVQTRSDLFENYFSEHDWIATLRDVVKSEHYDREDWLSDALEAALWTCKCLGIEPARGADRLLQLGLTDTAGMLESLPLDRVVEVFNSTATTWHDMPRFKELVRSLPGLFAFDDEWEELVRADSAEITAHEDFDSLEVEVWYDSRSGVSAVCWHGEHHEAVYVLDSDLVQAAR
jgi:hypothetical protein